MPPAPLVALDNADAVFAGKVIKIVPNAGDYPTRLLVTLEVDSYWKGDFGEVVLVETASNSAACGFPFEEGDSYLVYGNLYETNVLSTNLCTRTVHMDRAGADIRELGNPEREVLTRSRCGGPTNAAALQALMFLAVGMMFLRRRAVAAKRGILNKKPHDPGR